MSEEWVYGRHAVAAILARDPSGIRVCWVQEKRRDRHVAAARAAVRAFGFALHEVPRKTLDKMLEGAAHQGIALRYRATNLVKPLDWDTLCDHVGPDTLLLVLDGVQDPHNLGACLRSAAAAGVAAVIVPRSRSPGLTATVRKVACGAAETLPVLAVANLATALEDLRFRGLRVIGAEAHMHASLYETDLSRPLALVFGGEEKGLRRLTREHCDALFSIPMGGSMESLNVSVATGVCLFEAERRHRWLRDVAMEKPIA